MKWTNGINSGKPQTSYATNPAIIRTQQTDKLFGGHFVKIPADKKFAKENKRQHMICNADRHLHRSAIPVTFT